MPKPLDLVGKRFGMLTVKERISCYGNSKWLCECDCGNLYEAYATNLKSGKIYSCGCVKRRGKNPKDNVEETRLSALTRKKRKDANSTIKGVRFSEQHKKWQAYIGFKGKLINLGCYDSLNNAIHARKKAEKKYFKPILEKYNKK